MKLYVYERDIVLRLLQFAGVGPSYARSLAFIQALGDGQAVRGMKYILQKKQALNFSLDDGSPTPSTARLVRGKWEVAIQQIEVQGVALHLLTAYIPLGSWDGEDWYLFVTPEKPTPAAHDALFRRWAENHTPYPIPPTLSLRHVLAHSGPGHVFHPDEGAVTAMGRRVGGGKFHHPWVVAIKPEAFEAILKEVSYAA